ncbi:GFA family protein [Vibrio aphrogenes]|uniref:GFA family protein n=1 Tax=Vibrio aphrogenes TaxID=1891186 RepID=UPI000B362B78|nr:GFA family protein [Vibrio aphrogenes]
MIKKVADTDILLKHKASCHCGMVELELTLPNGIENPRRCDCSFCRRRGAIAASVKRENLKVIKGDKALRQYQFNTHAAKHYFCSQCGIYTHHQRRSNPTEYGYNVGCLEGVNPFDLGDIETSDGINHPSDR